MTNTLRTWLAGLALAFSALVLSAGSDPRGLGTTALLAMVVVFAHAWVVAVAERVWTNRGGIEIKRFPLGPRLLQSSPSLFPQLLLPAALLGLITQDWLVGALAAAIVTVLSVDLLRRIMPFALPAIAAVFGLLTMDEFYTLGDLVVTAREWMLSLLMLAMWALVIAGPLLRTDVAPPLQPKGKLVALLAGLPGYGAAFWIFSRTPLAGMQPDLLGLAVVLLAGGVLQTLIVGLMAKAAEITERRPSELPLVKGHDVGVALMPLCMPILACLAFSFAPMGPVAAAKASPAGWAGILAMLLIVPAVPAAGLVAASLDRVDGRSRARVASFVSVSALVLWFVFGPVALASLYARGGLIEGLRHAFPLVGQTWAPLAATGGVSLSGAALGGDLMLFGVPVADLLRGGTLMLLGCAFLSSRLMRHAAVGLEGPGWGTLTLLGSLQALGCWLLMPRMGPVGAVIATTGACLIMVLVDQATGVREVEAEAQPEFDGFGNQGDDLDDEIAPDPEGRELEGGLPVDDFANFQIPAIAPFGDDTPEAAPPRSR